MEPERWAGATAGDRLGHAGTLAFFDLRRDRASRSGALKRVGEQLGINPETMRNWVAKAEIDESRRPDGPSDEAKRSAELERKGKEPRRANEIFRTA